MKQVLKKFVKELTIVEESEHSAINYHINKIAALAEKFDQEVHDDKNVYADENDNEYCDEYEEEGVEANKVDPNKNIIPTDYIVDATAET